MFSLEKYNYEVNSNCKDYFFSVLGNFINK